MAIESIKQAVGAAIQSASEATGVDFDFLMRTAKRESGYNPSAKAPSSSAAGLFQFVEQTWLGALKRHGAKHGYGDYADLIQGSGDGHLSVSGGNAKKAVMALRLDPRAASLMAGELASDNAAYLKGRVGRDPTSGELYIAHFLGAKGSADLIETAQLRPAVPAASLFPEAASANPSIFYRDGRAASAGEVYSALTHGQPGQTATLQKAVDTEPAFIHTGKTRQSRLEQEKMLADMIMGMGQDRAGGVFGLGNPADDKASSAKGLTGSLFTSEMLTLLSHAQHGSGSKT
jgi:hypothetical protein